MRPTFVNRGEAMDGEATTVEGMEQNTKKNESYCLPNFKISVFIDQLAKMSKTAALDTELSQVLDAFLEKLAEYDAYIEHGIFNMNFAEAALLLQSSADVYNKKVELLWDVIFDCQKHLMQAEEQNGEQNRELEKLEERKRKYKRKRRTNADETQTVKLVNDFSFGNTAHIDYLNLNYEPIDLSSEWKKFQIDSSKDNCTSVTSVSTKPQFLPNTNIYNEDNDYIGRYDQFHSFTQFSDVQLGNEHHNPDTFDRVNPQTFRSVSECATEVVQEKCELVGSLEELERLCCKRSFVYLERLPFSVLQDKLRRCSTADSLYGDDYISLASNHSCSPSHHEKGRSKSCSQDSAFYDIDSIDAGINEQSIDVTNSKRQIESASIKTPLCLGSSIVISRKRKQAPLEKKDKSSKRIKLEKTKRTLKLITANHDDFENFFCVQYKPGEGEGISDLSESDAVTGIISNHVFEKFVRMQYKPREGEGIPDLSEFHESESSDDELDNVHDPDQEDQREETENDDHIEDSLAEEYTNRVDDSGIGDSLREDSPSRPTLSHQQQVLSRTMVQEWRTFIKPKLKALENKSDFDIHEYGSRIIEPSQIGEQRYFKDIVEGKTPAEVARYFIATLQLANAYNVEIAGAVPGELANETFQIKTLDKTKHHEMLEDYQAPSEETFRERVELAKSRNPNLQLHSTQSDAKRFKVGNVSWRRL